MQNITRFASINPANNQLIKSYKFLTDAALDVKLASAANGYKLHKNRTIAQRGELVSNMAQILEKRSDELAKMVAMEMGKPITAAKGEIMKTAGHFKYYAVNTERMIQPKPIACGAKKAYVQYQPIGPVLCNE